MAPKLFIAAIAVIAIAVGFILPGPHTDQVQARSQIQLQEVGVS
ncbi:hypothetical protein [Phenylobacterium sp.]|nr:hypothetical protein [Phenylobacterium sp.]